jgi:hypothetical protein
MTDGSETSSDDTSVQPAEPRVWAHPSEVGLALRGTSDRRRSSILATGVVLGGLGLLLSGMLLGSASDTPTATAESAPATRIEQSVATVMILRDGVTAVETGLVVDRAGHLLVPAQVLEGDTLWVRCQGSRTTPAEAIGTDATTGMTLLRPRKPGGQPPETGSSVRGAEVVLAHATVDGPVTTRGTVGDRVRSGADGSRANQVTGPVDPDGVTLVAADRHPAPRRLVFDRDGVLLGMTERAGTALTTLRPARELLATARQLLTAGS